MGLSWDLLSGGTGLDLPFLHSCLFGWTEEMDELLLLKGVFLAVVQAKNMQCQGCFHKGASPFFCPEDVITYIYYIEGGKKKIRKINEGNGDLQAVFGDWELICERVYSGMCGVKKQREKKKSARSSCPLLRNMHIPLVVQVYLQARFVPESCWLGRECYICKNKTKIYQGALSSRILNISPNYLLCVSRFEHVKRYIHCVLSFIII